MGSPPWASDGVDCQVYLDLSMAAARDANAYAHTGDQVGACAAARTSLHETLIAQQVCRGVGNEVNEMIAKGQSHQSDAAKEIENGK